MKDKIIMFVIGVLVGAVIATGIFLVLNQGKTSMDRGEMPQNMQFDNTTDGGNRPNRKMNNTTNNTTTNDTNLSTTTNETAQ